MNDSVLVVGAGVAGLAFARAVDAGRVGKLRILEKSRGVGGRCATRRVEGQPIDHGVPLLHGSSEIFLAQLTALGKQATLLRDWPWSLRGPGVPCQPQAYRSDATRAAVVQGVNQFPKLLADGLSIQRETKVSSVELDGDALVVTTPAETIRARTVVLTPPVDQTRALLEPLARHDASVRSILAVLSTVYTIPSLTVLAGYEARDEDWHIQLPGAESILHTVILDSSKGRGPATTLVMQSRSSFSRDRLEADPATWSELVVDAAAKLLGPWVRSPRWMQPHRWRFARVQRGHELAHPILLTLRGGARIGLCGEAFHPEGGVEGAFLSGIALARRLGALSSTLV